MDATIRTLAELEEAEIIKAMEHFAGHRVKAAASLGISVRTLHRKLKQKGWRARWPRRPAERSQT